MIASTTKLNTPGIALGRLDGVHALTDVTGFGLLGHLLEICRGSRCGRGHRLRQDSAALAGALELARDGHFTGASGRNWAGYGERRRLGSGIGDAERALLTDPQTSGGLLVACAPSRSPKSSRSSATKGSRHAAEIGEIIAGPPRVAVR